MNEWMDEYVDGLDECLAGWVGGWVDEWVYVTEYLWPFSPVKQLVSRQFDLDPDFCEHGAWYCNTLGFAIVIVI